MKITITPDMAKKIVSEADKQEKVSAHDDEAYYIRLGMFKVLTTLGLSREHLEHIANSGK